MTEFIKKHNFLIVSSLVGATGGFLYWRFVGCLSGTCPIKSIWYLSTLWGLLFGYFAGSILKDLLTKLKEKKAPGSEDSRTN